MLKYLIKHIAPVALVAIGMMTIIVYGAVMVLTNDEVTFVIKTTIFVIAVIALKIGYHCTKEALLDALFDAEWEWRHNH